MTIEAEVNTLQNLLRNYDFRPEPQDEVKADDEGNCEDTRDVKVMTEYKTQLGDL